MRTSLILLAALRYSTATDLIAHSRMIAVIPQSVANRFARHNLPRIPPYTFAHTLTSWDSLVHRDRYINPIMRRFLDLMHANTVA